MGDYFKRPGDRDMTGFGADFYEEAKPPPFSAREEISTRTRWKGDSDGEDPAMGDKKPSMDSAVPWYDNYSPLSKNKEMYRQLFEKRDNSVLGPHNQHTGKSFNIYDNIRKRVN